MSGLKFNKMSYKIQAEKKMKENSGIGFCLRKLVMLENMLVTNEAQFRYFYKQYTGHELLGGSIEDLNCMKLSILRELIGDIYSSIDEGGVYHESEEVQPNEVV